MARAIIFLFLFGSSGIFLASAARKRADSAKVVALISSHANHVAALEAQIAKLKSESQQLAAPVENALMDKSSPFSRVQIWGWAIESEDTDPNKIWGLTDQSGYLPEKLQQKDLNLEVEVNGFSTFKEYEAWLIDNRGLFGGGAHIDLYDPYVVVDGTYVGGYQGFVKAIVEHYPDSSEVHSGPIG